MENRKWYKYCIIPVFKLLTSKLLGLLSHIGGLVLKGVKEVIHLELDAFLNLKAVSELCYDAYIHLKLSGNAKVGI